MKQPLKFRKCPPFGHDIYAKKNNIIYKVCCNKWLDDKELNNKFYIGYYDEKAEILFTTESCRRFREQSEAIAFLQEIYEGSVDIEALYVEARTSDINRRKAFAEANAKAADAFLDKFRSLGISFVDCRDLCNLWKGLNFQARGLVYEANNPGRPE